MGCILLNDNKSRTIADPLSVHSPKLSSLNFHPLEFESRYRDPHQVKTITGGK